MFLCGHATLYLSYHSDILKLCVSLCFNFQCYAVLTYCKKYLVLLP